MFDLEFYPTPYEVIDQMGLNPQGKVILEPHAGSGNILDYCKINGAKDLICCEKNDKLKLIAKTKARFLKDDFFQVLPEEISHVNGIFMNPPFSNQEQHLKHAWNIAPDGCEIISLCNFDSFNHTYGFFKPLIRDYGSVESLGNCFSTAERKTNVNIGLIKLYKPVNSSEFDYSGFFMEEEEEEQGNGIMQYNEIRACVNSYVGAMKQFDEMYKTIEQLNKTTAFFNISALKLELGYNETITNKADFSKALQKKAWGYVINKMNLTKYVTTQVMKDINLFVEEQTKIPFTMRNVYKMLQIIHGTRDETFKRALEECVDAFTKHTHENRFGVEGWKTNSGYMLNKKVIIENVCEVGYDGLVKVKNWWGNFNKIDDLIKVLCNLTGKNYSKTKNISDVANGFETNFWYDWDFFEFKVFKKGTIHMKFKDINDWYILNQSYAKIKGFSLPETYKK